MMEKLERFLRRQFRRFYYRDYRSIKSYEDACCYLDMRVCGSSCSGTPSEVAFEKLRTINCALNSFCSTFERSSLFKFYPVFKIDNDSHVASYSGSVAKSPNYFYIHPLFGCYSLRIAQYFGRNFNDLWTAYFFR